MTEAHFKHPYIGTQFEKFANLVSNGRGADGLIEDDPLLYMQLSQAFAVAFSRGFILGMHVGMHESKKNREEIDKDIQDELAFISKRGRDIAAKLGVRTRNTREMDQK